MHVMSASTVMANEIPKKITLRPAVESSTAKRVYCTIYNCINTAGGACIQCASYNTSTVPGFGGCRGRLYNLERFLGISQATTTIISRKLFFVKKLVFN